MNKILCLKTKIIDSKKKGPIISKWVLMESPDGETFTFNTFSDVTLVRAVNGEIIPEERYLTRKVFKGSPTVTWNLDQQSIDANENRNNLEKEAYYGLKN